MLRCAGVRGEICWFRAGRRFCEICVRESSTGTGVVSGGDLILADCAVYMWLEVEL